MNRKIQLFNSTQIFILSLYLYLNKNKCDYMINLYSIPMCEYIMILLLLSIEINKIPSLIIVILLISIIGTVYYVYCYINAISKCSININSYINTYLIYILSTLVINNILLLVHYSSYLKNNIPFNPPIINEYTPLVSDA